MVSAGEAREMASPEVRASETIFGQTIFKCPWAAAVSARAAAVARGAEFHIGARSFGIQRASAGDCKSLPWLGWQTFAWTDPRHTDKPATNISSHLS